MFMYMRLYAYKNINMATFSLSRAFNDNLATEMYMSIFLTHTVTESNLAHLIFNTPSTIAET